MCCSAQHVPLYNTVAIKVFRCVYLFYSLFSSTILWVSSVIYTIRNCEWQFCAISIHQCPATGRYICRPHYLALKANTQNVRRNATVHQTDRQTVRYISVLYSVCLTVCRLPKNVSAAGGRHTQWPHTSYTALLTPRLRDLAINKLLLLCSCRSSRRSSRRIAFALICGALWSVQCLPPPTKQAVVDFMIDEEQGRQLWPSTLPLGNVKSAGVSIFDTVFQLTKHSSL